MSRKRTQPIPFWLTATTDGRESFTRIGQSLLKSTQFQGLSTGARYLYLCMTAESKGAREFTFPLSAAKAYGIAPRSLWRQVDELKKGGFVEFNSGANVRAPNLYTFSLTWRVGEEQ